jgi:hypothetical protein
MESLAIKERGSNNGVAPPMFTLLLPMACGVRGGVKIRPYGNAQETDAETQGRA